MKFYYVYIVKCSDSSYYTGITNDVFKRVDVHNSGIKPESYTYNKRPVELVFHYEFNDVTGKNKKHYELLAGNVNLDGKMIIKFK